MTTKKLTELTELTATATGDFTHVVDVSDTTDDPAGSSRKVQIGNLLPNTGVTAGAYGDSTHVAVITVNAKGQITSISAVSISGVGGGGITALTGDATASGTGSVAVTVTKINGQSPAAVATSGAYGDLTGKPSFATVATSGAYSDLSGKPTLGTAAALAAGTANGVATLDSSGKVPTAQIPASSATAGALTYGATVAWDWSVYRHAILTLTGNATLSAPTNLAPGRYSLTVKQDATGGRTLTLASGYLKPGALAPSFSTAANAIDLIDIIYDGVEILTAFQYGYA